MELLVLLCFILILILGLQNRKLSKKLNSLQIDLWTLESNFFKFTQNQENVSIKDEVKEHPLKEIHKDILESSKILSDPKIPDSPPVIETPSIAFEKKEIYAQVNNQNYKKASLKKKLLTLWKKFEKPILENWTGIIGAIILIMGVGFLGIYGAFYFDPLGRSIIILTFGLILYSAGHYLRAKIHWTEFSLVLKSTGSAILLIVSIGVSEFSGLQWIQDSNLAGLVLLLGLAFNLYTGLQTNKQIYLSLHSILSLIAISFYPSLVFSLVLGSMITLISLWKNYRQKWEWNLLFLLSGFFIFELVGLTNQYEVWKESGTIRIFILSLNIIVYGFALCIHYKNQLYISCVLEKFPLINHILMWFYLSITLLIMSTGNPLNSIGLLLSACLVFWLSSLAKRKGIQWLYILDRLVSLGLGYAFAVSLEKWNFQYLQILSFLGIETLFFLFLVHRDKIKFLTWTSYGISFLVFIVLFFSFLFHEVQLEHLYFKEIFNLSSYLTFLFLGVLVLNKINSSENAHLEKTLNSLRFLLGFMYTGVIHFFWEGVGGAGGFGLSLISFLLFRNFISFKSMFLGIWSAMVISSIYIWYQIPEFGTGDSVRIYIWLIVLFSTNLFSIFLSRNEERKYNTEFGIYLTAANTIIISLWLLHSSIKFESTIGLGFIAILFLEVSKGLKQLKTVKRETFHFPEKSILNSGFFLVFTFIIEIYFYTTKANPDLIYQIYAILGFGTIVLGFWIFRTWKNEKLTILFTWVKPILWEMSFALSFLWIYTETFWSGLFLLGILSYLLLFFGRLRKQKRLLFYSFAILVIQGTIFCSQIIDDKNTSSEFLWGLGIIISQIIYLCFFFGYPDYPRIVFPRILNFFNRFTSFIYQHKSFFYHLSISVLLGIIILEIHNVINPVSNLAVGIAWLSLSPIMLEGLRLVQKKSIQTKNSLHLFSFLLIPMFLIRFVLVDLQSESYLGIFPIKLYIEFYGILVLGYWYHFQNNFSIDKKYSNYTIELGILLCIFIVDTISPSNWKAINFSILSIGLFFISNYKNEFSRLKEYSLFLHWYVLLQLAFFSGMNESSPGSWFSANWFSGIFALLMQVFYLYSRYKEQDSYVSFPPGYSFLERVHKFYSSKKDFALFYPFFSASFLFLYWGFESAILTLLWTTLAFCVFVLSIVLGKKHFLYTSLGLLLFCIFRLIFHDMSSSSTITKAIVFLGVGSILLFMNSLHNRFRDRF